MDQQTAPHRLEPGFAPVVMLDDGTFLVAGIAGGVPETVELLPNGDRGLAWRAHTASWPLLRAAGEAGSAFIAIFPLPARAREGLVSVSLSLAGGKRSFALRHLPGGLGGFFKTVIEEAGPAYLAVVDGLVEMLLGEDAGPARARAVAALLRLAARHAGFVEVVGASLDGEMFVQGWATDLVVGRLRVLTAGEPPMVAELACAAYPRDDLAGNARGFIGTLEGASLAEGGPVRQIFFRGRDGWAAIDLYEQHKRLAQRDVPGHVRGLLPRVAGPADILARLQRLAHRFDGRETISQIQLPVRLGIDLAVSARGSGVLIAGWLLDPAACVREVRLRSGTGSVVVSEDWTRTTRADVVNAFSGDPSFRGLPLGKSPAGFIAFAPRIEAVDADAHLELDLGDAEPPRHFPLAIQPTISRATVSGLLAAIDPRSAAAARTIARQIEPMLRAYERPEMAAPATEDFGSPADFDGAPVALVIGADQRIGEMTSLLAILAADPSTRSLPIVLAAPAGAAAEVAGEISRLASFYRLSVRLALTPDGSDVFDSMVAGAAATGAGTLLLLSGEVLPLTRGWADLLLRAYRLRGEQPLVSATILFDDGSLRWAGAWLEDEDGKRGLSTPHVGYPRETLGGLTAAETSCGTLECCVLPAAAIRALRGASAGYLGAAARNLDLALRLRLGGTPSVWFPEVEMVAASDAVGAGAEMAARVDRAALDHRWSLAIRNLSR